MLDPDPNPVQKDNFKKYLILTESVVHSGSAKAKSYSSCGSGTNRYVTHPG
jgi:hypothetical protein